MSFEKDLFRSLTYELNTRAARALISTWAPLNQPLRKYLLDTFETQPGSGHSFLAEPVFESLFPWLSADVTMDQLSKDLLHPLTVQALDQAEQERFARHFFPHKHQLEAWQHLMQPEIQSVIVSSGTGSGKTEAFMIPVIDDLVRESQQSGPLTGVRALFLYPLNALIANQRHRLGSWLKGLNGDVRYCLYNGNTPESVKASEQRAVRYEVLSRTLLRSNPPPIIVTNPTMLEYMLVRHNDAPIIEQSAGTLRWIILDEAHTYVGSQAAELSLLLRRVLHAFGRQAKDVRFVATSATMSSDGADSDDELREFLANIAGVDSSQVKVVKGNRRVPEIPEDLRTARQPLPTNTLQLKAHDDARRYQSLSQSHAFRALRDQISQKAITLSQARQTLTQHDELASAIENSDVLDLLDAARGARLEPESEPLLPLRAHLFMRAQAGVWACVNHHCAGRTGALKDTNWKFGGVFFKRRTACPHCSAKVFEVVLCSCCGADYLEAELVSKQNVEPHLAAISRDQDDEGELLPEVQAQHSDDIDEHSFDDLDLDDPVHRHRRLIGYWNQAYHPEHLNFDIYQGVMDSNHTIPVLAPRASSNKSTHRLVCSHCGEPELREGSLFRSLRSGAPSMLSVAIPTLLEHTPDAPKDAKLKPYHGRQTITFTDSRHATAAFALRTQQNTERNFLRSWLYHELWREAHATSAVTPEKISKLQAAIDGFLAMGADDENHIFNDPLLDTQKELAAAIQPAEATLSWRDAVKNLQNSSILKQMINHWKRIGAYQPDNEADAAELLLIREFMSRPMRQNSMESLGLVQLDFPSIDKQIKNAPPNWTRCGQTAESWQKFLKITLNYYVRNVPAVWVDQEMVRWIGMRHNTKHLLSPDADPPSKKERYKYHRWPLATRSTQSRLVRMLAILLHQDLQEYQDRLVLDEILREAWKALIESKLLSQPSGEMGYQLRFDTFHNVHGAAVVFKTLRHAWLCPVSAGVLDTTVDGVTYFVTRASTLENARCKPIEIPAPPQEIIGVSSQGENAKLELLNWLSEDPGVNELRALGVWSEHNDRVASWNPYFSIAEHSAQQTPAILKTYEDSFRAQQLNVLSCSTTMEMGVDIGGLMSVAMNNAPPAPANYRQRAGRAGRRNETAAIAFTLCQSTPHGEAVFQNPLWPFTTHVAVPHVALESERIVQRHINALVLTQFLKTSQVEGTKIETGWFFVPDDREDTQVERFRNWLESEEIQGDSWLLDGIEALTERSALESIDAEELLRLSAQMMLEIEQSWRAEYEALLSIQKSFGGPAGDSPGARANRFQIDRLTGEYLLGFLASQGFLPGYGFPTGIVPFVNTNIDDVKAAKITNNDDGKPNEQRSSRRNYPTRPLPMAIRNYAPGNSVIINHKVYESRGISMNWKIPANDQSVNEIQALGYFWRCTFCGNVGRSALKPTRCNACNHTLTGENCKKLLTPAGFTIDIRSKPHSNIKHSPYVPVLPPLISVAGVPWVTLVAGRIGRYRASHNGRLIHYSAGANGRGYAICLQCGFAASEEASDHPAHFEPLPIMQEHRPLRGGSDKRLENETLCRGTQLSYATQRGIFLGGEEITDVFELQLMHPTEERPLTKDEAISIAVALREALCRALGIETRELGYGAHSANYAGGQQGYSIMLFDVSAGGAGYSTQAGHMITALLEACRERAQCAEQCDSACQTCLLEYDTQFDLKHLDRHRILDVISDELLHGLKLPESLRFFGSSSEFDNRSTYDAVTRTMERSWVTTVRFYAGGAPQQWSWWEWPMQNHLHALLARRVRVELVLSEQTLAQLPIPIALTLANLLDYHNATGLLTIHIVEAAQMRAHNGYLLAEIGGHERSVRWATPNEQERSLHEGWGEPDNDNSTRTLVRSEPKQNLSELASRQLTAAEIRPASDDTLQFFSIQKQLNGPLKEVGRKFWLLIHNTFPAYKQLLQSQKQIVSIRYSDRYVVSPFVAAALYQILRALSAQGALQNATFSLCTRQPRNEGKPAYRLTHNWNESTTHMHDILQRVYNPLVKTCAIDVRDSTDKDLPHHRALSIRWQDGSEMTIHLDQGFGFLTTPGRNLQFDFAASQQEQARAIQELNVSVINKEPQSFVYVLPPVTHPAKELI